MNAYTRGRPENVKCDIKSLSASDKNKNIFEITSVLLQFLLPDHSSVTYRYLCSQKMTDGVKLDPSCSHRWMSVWEEE